ncbi:MAG: helix-turn-helix domain-containing protein, partial [Chloroflexi bacterium]
MSDTLNTEGAARFLGVSEASIRRWSDLGLLAVERRGRRGVRRFAPEELVRFRTREAAPAPARHRQDSVAIGALRLPLHSHLATFYDSDASRLRLTAPFLRDGLLAGEPCFLVASGE